MTAILFGQTKRLTKNFYNRQRWSLVVEAVATQHVLLQNGLVIYTMDPSPLVCVLNLQVKCLPVHRFCLLRRRRLFGLFSSVLVPPFLFPLHQLLRLTDVRNEQRGRNADQQGHQYLKNDHEAREVVEVAILADGFHAGPLYYGGAQEARHQIAKELNAHGVCCHGGVGKERRLIAQMKQNMSSDQ